MLYVQSIIEKEKKKKGDIFVNGDLNNGFNPYFREKRRQNKLEEKKNKKIKNED